MGIIWDPDKSERLKATRGMGFNELLDAGILAMVQHPTRRNQKLLLFEVAGYVWAAPCVNRGEELFLKTAFRSRKHTKLWRRGELP